jgi:hypothetical protein
MWGIPGINHALKHMLSTRPLFQKSFSIFSKSSRIHLTGAKTSKNSVLYLTGCSIARDYEMTSVWRHFPQTFHIQCEYIVKSEVQASMSGYNSCAQYKVLIG